jgi:hypothetical protein
MLSHVRRRFRIDAPGIFAVLLLIPQIARANPPSAPAPLAVSDPRMAEVLASTRNASLAAAKLLGAGVTGSPLTSQIFEDIAVVDAALLESPLTPSEQAAGRDNIVAQCRANPEAFSKAADPTHKVAEILLHGSPSEQMQARTVLWLGWLQSASGHAGASNWVATVRRHNTPIVSANNLTVTNRQLDAIFVSDDWVAKAAHQPLSTPASRAAFAQSLPSRFASLPPVEQHQLALADVRWDAFEAVLEFGLQQKAVQIAQQNVRAPGDVSGAARYLEDSSIQFIQGLNQFNQQMWSRTLAIMGGTAQGSVAESINMAQNRFEGKFDAEPHH